MKTKIHFKVKTISKISYKEELDFNNKWQKQWIRRMQCGNRFMESIPFPKHMFPHLCKRKETKFKLKMIMRISRKNYMEFRLKKRQQVSRLFQIHLDLLFNQTTSNIKTLRTFLSSKLREDKSKIWNSVDSKLKIWYSSQMNLFKN